MRQNWKEFFAKFREDSDEKMKNRILTHRHQKRAMVVRGLALAFLSFMALMKVSTAWYSANEEVRGNGMMTEIEVSPNLIISADKAEIGSITSLEDSWHVEFLDDEKTLVPARHNEGIGSPVGLEYNTNPKFVDTHSGEKAAGAKSELTFGAVPVYAQDDPKQYYFDYVVYIAATEKAIDVTAMNVAVTLAADAEKDYMQALSTDFYLEDQYCGTLNAAGLDWENTGNALVTLDLVAALNAAEGKAVGTSLTVPHNTDGYLTLIMRSYFDGGLKKVVDGAVQPNQDYVYSYNLVMDEYEMTIDISSE